MTIADVLAECEKNGIPWQHPLIATRDRICAAWITCPNGWQVSIGCCDSHYCDNRDIESLDDIDIYDDSKTAAEWFAIERAEIAIFRPDGSWYIPEGEEAHGARTWVGGWWSAERIQSVIAYIAAQ